MGFFDSFSKSAGVFIREKAMKNKEISDYVECLSEDELRAFYKKSKRKGEYLAMMNASKMLKERYGYTSEDIEDI